MSYLLLPGRHLVNTRFQETYLLRVLRMPVAALPFQSRGAALPDEPLDEIVFAVTSSNQQNSRYNPIPFHVRAIGVDRFARRVADALGVGHRIVGVPHFGHSTRFAGHTLREIEEQTEGRLRLTPQNTIVVCATPEVIAMYEKLGFGILPGELAEPPERRPLAPVDLIRRIAELGDGWSSNADLREALSPASFSLFTDFPDVPVRVARLYRDPLLNDEGSLTSTRNYAVYAWQMSNPAAVELKYRDIRPAVVPGKIVDEGCADGALLVPIARDFPDSDLVGIEITGEFLGQCQERLRRCDFGGTYVHFHQRNLMEEIFEPSSIDTTICNSTVHELWSYGQQAQTIATYLARKHRQTRRGGRIIIRDVVGPDQRDAEVCLWCNDADGDSAADPLALFTDAGALAKHLASLTTAGRFRRFARDFLVAFCAAGRRAEADKVRYREETIAGRRYFVLRLKDAAEFLLKKDYLDSWDSEMHEEFAHWSFGDWKSHLAAAGFHVIEDPNDPESGSRAYANPWIVDHRYRGKVELYARTNDGALRQIEFPPTNVVMVGEKR